jgi:tetratricopeptide (TPR) repeat protein
MTEGEDIDMPTAITREMAELAKRVQDGIQSGNKKEVLEATGTLEIEFSAAIDGASSTERMAILGMCYYAYQSVQEWEMAALKIEDSICYAEKHHRNSPETAADYAHLAEAYLLTGDSRAAVSAMETAIAQMKETSEWQSYRMLYEKSLEEMTGELRRSGQGQARRNPRLLRCSPSVVAEEQILMKGGKFGSSKGGYPDKFPQFDPIYVMIWELERLPSLEETSAIVYGFVEKGELPQPDEKTRLLRMRYTGDWENPNSLPFNIAVHKLLKRTFGELAPYLLVSDEGFERDDRVKLSVVSGIGCIGNPPSEPLRFRVVEVRPKVQFPGNRSVSLLATYVLRQRTTPSENEARDIARNCLREQCGESALRACVDTPALQPAHRGGYLFSSCLRKPGDVRELMPGFIRSSGNDQLLDFPADYHIAYSVIQSGQPSEPTCIALCFGPEPAEFDPHLVDAAGIAESRGDDAEAARLLRLGAAQGIAQAQYNLAVLLYEGRGVPQNHQEAVAWFRKAADKNYPNAVYMLAFMLENGYGCTEDLRSAYQLYQRGAALNEEDSQLKAACLLLSAKLQARAGLPYRKKGWDFVSANDAEAVQRLRKLSEAGATRATGILRSLDRAGG